MNRNYRKITKIKNAVPLILTFNVLYVFNYIYNREPFYYLCLNFFYRLTFHIRCPFMDTKV